MLLLFTAGAIWVGDIVLLISELGIRNIKWLLHWLKEAPTTYTTKLNLKGVSVGAYSWAVGLVDVTKDNEIGLEMAVNKDANLLDSGWLKLQTLTVK